MDKDILEELTKGGYTTYKLAELLNISQTNVRYWLKKLGLKTNYKRKSIFNNLEFWKVLQEYHNLGFGYRECYRKFGVSMDTISKAKKLGLIKTRTNSESINLFYSTESIEHKKDRAAKTKLGQKNSKKDQGGYRAGAGRSKKFKVIDSFGQPVTLQSSYENDLFQILLEENIKWIRPSFLRYIDGKIQKKYFPDFYLTDYQIYIDTKNDYLIKIDKKKIKSVEKQNNLKIYILNKYKINVCYLRKILG